MAEIREMLGGPTLPELRGAHPIEDAADDLLAEVDALRDDLAEALALVEHPTTEQIAFLDAYAERTP